MAQTPQFTAGDWVNTVVAAVLFGMSAGLVTVNSDFSRVHLPHREISGRRIAALRDATGTVFGNDSNVRKVARQQHYAAASAAVFMFLAVVTRPNTMNVLAGVAVVAGAWQVPLLRARTVEKKRRHETDIELTDTLGEMVMGVEAGLTLEAVMNLYAQRHVTPLSAEFRWMLDRINLGTSRSTALQELSERTPTLEMQMFVSALQQNQKLGTPLAEVLRQQGASSRRRRRQAIEEAAAKLSLKMIFPTVFCVLPVLLIVIVGPAIVRLVHTMP